MRTLLNSIFALVLAAFIVSPAVAQTDGQQDQAYPEQMDQGQMGQQQDKTTVTAEEIQNKKVVTRDNQEVGSVEKVLVNTQDDKVIGVVVKTSSGMFGMGEQEFKILPFEKIEMQQDNLVVQMDMQQIDQAPSRNNADQIDEDWIKQSFQAFGVEYQAGSAQEQGGQDGQGGQGGQNTEMGM